MRIPSLSRPSIWTHSLTFSARAKDSPSSAPSSTPASSSTATAKANASTAHRARNTHRRRPYRPWESAMAVLKLCRTKGMCPISSIRRTTAAAMARTLERGFFCKDLLSLGWGNGGVVYIITPTSSTFCASFPYFCQLPVGGFFIYSYHVVLALRFCSFLAMAYGRWIPRACTLLASSNRGNKKTIIACPRHSLQCSAHLLDSLL